MQRTCFYGGLGGVAIIKFIGPPQDQMHFVWLISPEILIFFSQSLTLDFSSRK